MNSSIIQMFPVFLFVLSQSVLAATYTYQDVNITIQTISTGPVANPSSLPQACGKMIARNNMFYSINADYVFQMFLKGSIGTPTMQNNQATPPDSMIDFDVDALESIISFITTSKANTYLYGLNFTTNTTNLISSLSLNSPTRIAISASEILFLTPTGRKLEIRNLAGVYQRSIDILSGYNKMAVTPDFSKVILWKITNEMKIYQTTNLTNIFSWTPPVTVPKGLDLTSKLTFSQDSSLVIIQIDALYPIQIMNLNSFEIVHSFSISDTIEEAHFLDASNQLVIVFGASSNYILNLVEDRQYPFPASSAVSMTADRDFNFFTCKNSTITQQRVTFARNVENEFFFEVEMDEGEQNFFTAVNNTLTYSSNSIFTILTIFDTLPFAIYFLGFINYFTMSSIYVLLNFAIPEQTYRYFSFAYKQISKDILALFGVELDIPRLSQERVKNSKKGVFFGVSSDFVPNNTVAFIFLGANIVFILLLQAATSCLRKSSYLRKIVRQQKWTMIYGQVINIMAPLILPWTFVMLESGVRNFKNKISIVGNILVFFFGFVFPIYYFFELLQERQELLIKENRQKMKKLQEQQKNFEKRAQIQAQKQKQRKQTKYLSEHKLKEKLEKLKKELSVKAQKQRDKLQKMTEKSKSSFKKKQKSFENNLKNKLTKKKSPFKVRIDFEPQVINLQSKTKRNIQQKNSKTISTKKEEIFLSDLVTSQILQQWYFCQTNFLLPCLVLLSNPLYFLIVVFFYSILGMVIAFKKREQRINSFVLSIYPFIFHVCFMIFYWVKSEKVLVLTQLVCLAVFLLGIIHHCLTAVYEIMAFLFRSIKKICFKSNKIDPEKEVKKKQNGSQKVKNKANNANDVEKKRNKSTNRSVNEKSKTKIKRERSSPNQKNMKVDFLVSRQNMIQ